MTTRDSRRAGERPDYVAGGGLLHRRTLLTGGAAAVGAVAASGLSASTASAATLDVPPWMQTPGAPFRNYGMPSAHEEAVQRGVLQPYGDLAPGAGVSMTPLHQLNGTITPNGLHFERHHNGVPDIDPAAHKLLLHGQVSRNLTFEVNDLLRYPMTSRTCFIECSGNSFFNAFAEPQQMPCGMIHGLVSCSEWTGVSLAVLLDEAGVDPIRQSWLLAEGADSAAMSRSVPMEKAMGDAIIALYQNGERIRPEQGYPMRLLLPGFEGNMSVKWLRRLKVTDQPTHTKDETSKYTELMPDGQGPPVHLCHGREIDDHASILRHDHVRAGLLRDLGTCLVRSRQDHQGRDIGRWRCKLGGRSSPRTRCCP